ncbi:unnamed protein product, partial [Sphagnum balticum]
MDPKATSCLLWVAGRTEAPTSTAFSSSPSAPLELWRIGQLFPSLVCFSNKALLVCQQQPQVRQHHNNNRVIPISSAAAVALPGVLEEQEVVDIERLEEELNSASPFEIMDQALALFGTDIAILILNPVCTCF